MSHREAARAAFIVLNEIILLRKTSREFISREYLSIEYAQCLDPTIQTYLESCFKAVKAVLKEVHSIQIKLEIMQNINCCAEVWELNIIDESVSANELKALLQHIRSSEAFLNPLKDTTLFRVYISVPAHLKFPSQCVQHHHPTGTAAVATEPTRFRAAGGMEVEVVEFLQIES